MTPLPRQDGTPARRLCAGLVLAASAFVVAPAQASPDVPPQRMTAPPAPMAVAWKLEKAGATTRLSFDLSRALSVRTSFLEGPDRLVVDLPEVNFQIDPLAGRLKGEAGSLVKSFRFGLFAPGRSRIIVDLGAPASLVGVGSAAIAGGDPSRLLIELARSDRATFHRAAVADAAAQPEPAKAAPVPTAGPAEAGRRPVVVIDPGHGGIDPGARGLGGVVEKSITFDFAKTLADKLNASGRYTAVMTRTDDSFVSLGDRVEIARNAGAALFVSIHADTLSSNLGVTGATVYTCSDKASDAEAARVAATENEADTVGGVATAPEASGVNDILFDLTRRETRTYAHLFQRTLVGYWQKIARLNKNPERAAGFKVLQAPDVPSVLLELGYLSSDKDIQAMTSPAWREQATGSVVASIDAFFAPRQAPPSPAALSMSDAANGPLLPGTARSN